MYHVIINSGSQNYHVSQNITENIQREFLCFKRQKIINFKINSFDVMLFYYYFNEIVQLLLF